MMGQLGDNVHYISLNFGDSPNRNLTFLGWMDNQTVAYSGYTGGGSHKVTILDIFTREYVTWYEVLGSIHNPNFKYIPVSTHYPIFTTIPLSKTNLSKEEGNFFNALDIENYPTLNLQPDTRYSINFEDWLP